MPNNREAIIQISATISRLREESARIKDELKRHETQLDRLLSGGDIPSQSTREIQPSSGDPNERSLNQRIIDLLESASERQFTADDIAAYLPDANITSIRSGLARLADQNRIKRAGRGHYAGAPISLRADESGQPEQTPSLD